jgi:hypothetical protein
MSEKNDDPIGSSAHIWSSLSFLFAESAESHLSAAPPTAPTNTSWHIHLLPFIFYQKEKPGAREAHRAL